MDSLRQPLERVVEASEWFVRTPAVRLLYVTTSGMLRNTVLQHITATELLEQNTAPFFVLEAATEPGDDGWSLRVEELRGDWEGLAETAPNDASMAPLGPPLSAPSACARFRLELGRALAVLRKPMTGLVIVLAPVWLRDRETWVRDLELLLREPGLAQARFIVVECDTTDTLPIVERMREAGEIVDARIDEAALRAEASRRLEACESAPPGASGPRLTGAAGPSVAPPRRPKEPRPMSPAEREGLAAKIGVPKVLLDPSAMQRLRALVLSAASKAASSPADAIRTQTDARDFCVEHGLAREAVVNELVLGGYVLQAGHPERSLDVFASARARAEPAGFGDLAVQAQMATGACLLVLQRIDEAITAYAEAGRLGADANAPIMAIEAYRMAGQLLVTRGRTSEAASAFRRALDVADGGDPQMRRNSTADEAARSLAALCRRHGLVQQAESLEAQAAALSAEAIASPQD
jgi:hypothetical protein